MQCALDAVAADRANVDALAWLGAHFVRRQDYVGALPYFEAAARAQPREVCVGVGGVLARVRAL